MNVAVNRMKEAAVDQSYFWQPMQTCPVGVKVQILPKTGVARYDRHNGRESDAVAWAPLPNVPTWLKEAQHAPL